ncbi:MAG: hypothetical protein ABGZ36_16590 [Actinomycetota bacterium]
MQGRGPRFGEGQRRPGVGAIPTQVFHEDPSAHHGLVRFAFCKTDEALAEGIERLRNGLPGMARPDDR